MKRSMVKKLLIIVLIGSVFLGTGCVRKDNIRKKTNSVENTHQEETTDQEEKNGEEVLAVIKEINQKNSQITVRELENPKNIYTLTYSGSTSIKNRYGSQVLIDSFIEGDIVNISYLKGKQKLVGMEEPEQVWTNDSVTKWKLDEENRTIKIGTEKYKYNENLYVNNKREEIELSDLADVDKLQVRGMGDYIYSVTVIMGHGYVQLLDVKEFIGGMVDFDGKYLTRISADSVIQLPKGDYQMNVWIKNKNFSTEVKVTENEKTKVSLGQFQSDIELNGALNLKVLPEGTKYNVFIDNVLVKNDEVIDLPYGKHWLVITSDGYTDYSEYIKISSIYTNKTIDLSLAAEIEKTETTTEAATKKETGDDKDKDDKESDTTEQAKDIEEEENGIKVTMEVEEPVGASMYIDGKLAGVIPCQITKTVGKHSIVLRQTGYENVAYNVAFSTDDDGATLKFSEMVKRKTEDSDD